MIGQLLLRQPLSSHLGEFDDARRLSALLVQSARSSSAADTPPSRASVGTRSPIASASKPALCLRLRTGDQGALPTYAHPVFTPLRHAEPCPLEKPPQHLGATALSPEHLGNLAHQGLY